MRRLYGLIAAGAIALAVAVVAQAGTLKNVLLPVTIGTNSTATVAYTNATLTGYVEEIKIASTTGATGDVSVVIAPHFAAFADVNLATNPACASEYVVRPARDRTGIDGVALTGDPPARYVIAGDPVIFSVTGVTGTNKTWQCLITLDQ